MLIPPKIWTPKNFDPQKCWFLDILNPNKYLAPVLGKKSNYRVNIDIIDSCGSPAKKVDPQMLNPKILTPKKYFDSQTISTQQSWPIKNVSLNSSPKFDPL